MSTNPNRSEAAPPGMSAAGTGGLRTVNTATAPAAIGPYSQAVAAGGLLFCSGQIPLDPASGTLVNSNITAATEQVLKNLRAVLQAAGLDFASVVKTTVYLARMEDFAAMNEVYARRFGAAKPARACVQVARLPKDALVEIDAIATMAPGTGATAAVHP